MKGLGIRQVTFNKEVIGFKKILTAAQIHAAEDARMEINACMDQAAYEVLAWFHAMAKDHQSQPEQWHEVYYPATWWQHLKQAIYRHRWTPAWLLLWLHRRWPVVLHEERFVIKFVERRICPHIHAPTPNNYTTHFAFMLKEDDEQPPR